MYPKAYVDYLIYFHGLRDYFECHEVLEEYWKSKEKSELVWVGLIQLAVALYHQRRGNMNGAQRMMDKAYRILDKENKAVSSLGIDLEILLKEMEIRKIEIVNKDPYRPFNIPLTDQNLLKLCEESCLKKGVIWGQSVNEMDEFLVHKHTLRDRSDVIAERDLQKKKRRG